MHLRSMLDARARTVAEMRKITGAPAGDNGDISGEQSATFDRLKGELSALDTRIDRQRLVDEAERRVKGETITTTGDGKLDAELRSFSLVKAIVSQIPDARGSVDCGRELELSQEIARRSGRKFQGMAVPMSVFHAPVEQRVLTTVAPVGGPGSNIIATDYLGNAFIDKLRAALVTRRLGATILSGLVGNVDIPRLKASAATGWVAENAALSASDPQYEKVSLSPKHAGALVEFSRNMLLQSSPDIEALVRDDFAKIIAETVDTAAINGSGSSNQPRGILNTSGIGSVAIGTNGGPITWGACIDLIAECAVDNVEGSGFMTNAKVVKSARKTAKVSSTDSVMVMEDPRTLAGYPLVASNLVPSTLTKGTSSGVCSALIFGAFSDLVLGYWSELDLLINPYETTAYSKGNVQARAMVTMDVAVRHAESFAACVDLTTP